MKRPCEEASAEPATVDSDQGIEKLLRTFSTTHFGFAMVERRHEEGGLVTIADVLGLYASGAIRTHFAVGDVASPTFSLPPRLS